MESNTIKSYLYQQYQDDLDLQAFVNAYNAYTQSYVDWYNQTALPIYAPLTTTDVSTGLSITSLGLTGALLDWVGAGLYGYPRPTIGTPAGAIYGTGTYGVSVYGAGNVGSVTLDDDYYRRVLTWKLYRGDGFYMSLNWLKRRIKRFLTGANGTVPSISTTAEISVTGAGPNGIIIVINYPSDPAAVNNTVTFLNSGVLDTPWQYPLTARSA